MAVRLTSANTIYCLVFAGSGRGKKIREVRSGKEGERRDAVKRAGRYRALVQEAVLGRVARDGVTHRLALPGSRPKYLIQQNSACRDFWPYT